MLTHVFQPTHVAKFLAFLRSIFHYNSVHLPTSRKILICVVSLVICATVFKSGLLEELLPLEKMGDIYFLETGGEGRLSLRQLCAVESAARWSGNRRVYVLAEAVDFTGQTREEMRALQEQRAVTFNVVSFRSLVSKTPIASWYNKAVWKKSPYRINHLSDAIRLALIWKTGGVYLDLDFIIQRPLPNLKNTVVWQQDGTLANGFLSFQRGHPLLEESLRDVGRNYDPHAWGGIGPWLLTRNYKKYCGHSPRHCRVRSLPPKTLFPISYPEYRELITDTLTDQVMGNLSDSLAVHFWNKLSSNHIISVKNDCVYIRMARAQCPIIFRAVLREGVF